MRVNPAFDLTHTALDSQSDTAELQNGPKRVSSGLCERCGGSVAKPRRGPTARQCLECAAITRATRNVGYLLRAAARLAATEQNPRLARRISRILADEGAHTLPVGLLPAGKESDARRLDLNNCTTTDEVGGHA